MENLKNILKNVPKKYYIITVIIIVLLIIFTIGLCIYSSNNKTDIIETDSMETAIEENDEDIENQDTLTVEVSELNEEVQTMENLPEENKNEVSNKPNKENNENKPKYYIKVNYTANVVTIYTMDSNKEYTVPYKAMVCSTGIDTPKSGVYKMSGKYRWLLLFGGVYGQYSSRITGHILFHSVPYLAQSPDSLEYWEYDKLGTSASAGCIRLAVVDAKWIYDNCSKGTCVEFYSSSDPGPLGKPSSQKISSNEQCRNWDPTDSTSGNPWKSYVPDLGGQANPVEQNKPNETKPQEPSSPEETNPQQPNNPDETKPQEPSSPQETNPQEPTKPEEKLPDTNENDSNEQEKVEDSNTNENEENLL